MNIQRPEVPSMPILAKPSAGGTSIAGVKPHNSFQYSGGEPLNAEHQDNVADKGFVSESWMAMVQWSILQSKIGKPKKEQNKR